MVFFMLLIIFYFAIGNAVELDSAENNYWIGHMKPFGAAGAKHLSVEIVNGFPTPEEFHRTYVTNFTPLLMRDATTKFAAHTAWSDEKLLKIDLRNVQDRHVHVETLKKESRTQDTIRMHFHEFLKKYNDSELYIVGRVPSFMAMDLPIPWPFQCEGIRQAIIDCLMWFSSGGTSSVVHTDQVDNINCLIAGNKTFILVNPQLHGDKIPIMSNGSYSSIDVDAVDYHLYSKMHRVEFYHVHMQAGDCLYIPFKWIHQVRSFGRNIAVNFWWDRSQVDSALNEPSAVPKECAKSFNLEKTVKSLQVQGLETLEYREMIKDAFYKYPQGMNVNNFIKEVALESHTRQEGSDARFNAPLVEIYNMVDYNRDGLIFFNEINSLKSQVWKEIGELFDTHYSMVEDYKKNKDEL